MKKQNININQDYKYGFITDIENIRAPKGLSEQSIKFISNIKKEPKWMLDWRLKAFERLKTRRSRIGRNQNIPK
jgi:Fe-S cluster assembly protein SufB